MVLVRQGYLWYKAPPDGFQTNRLADRLYGFHERVLAGHWDLEVQAILNSYERMPCAVQPPLLVTIPAEVFQTNTTEWTWEAASGRFRASPGP